MVVFFFMSQENIAVVSKPSGWDTYFAPGKMVVGATNDGAEIRLAGLLGFDRPTAEEKEANLLPVVIIQRFSGKSFSVLKIILAIYPIRVYNSAIK